MQFFQSLFSLLVNVIPCAFVTREAFNLTFVIPGYELEESIFVSVGGVLFCAEYIVSVIVSSASVFRAVISNLLPLITVDFLTEFCPFCQAVLISSKVDVTTCDFD